MFQEEKNRFYLTEEGKMIAEITWEILGDGSIDVNHTFVDSSQRGKGLAEKLVLEVIKKAQIENITIIPTCSYVAKYFETHETYQYLLKK
ncbi:MULTISPECIES: GNAT family N-acetyltransferase [Vagococcus]|uniref:Acetyltransferase (Putative) n=1 Tax=Vagococcus fluvialis bH819 TaxID=1255619 RepID=A0A1X6WMN3_9ENTE|nr:MULTISPECIES: GNAT family N-acetyltransferase [Vagococcus]SLM85593.1 acetyltransferase (putative) [Vagococcus fluvialis bH819]HCM89562.1 N-acetyltransferase [Vagococcus sp.]